MGINPTTSSPTKIYNGNVGDECAMCLHKFEPKDILAILNCGHALHKGCELGLRECPLDRRTITAIRFVNAQDHSEIAEKQPAIEAKAQEVNQVAQAVVPTPVQLSGGAKAWMIIMGKKI